MTKTKTDAQLDQEVARLIAGDAELEGTPSGAAKAAKIRKAAKIPRTGARGGPLLGYTESKKPVHAPARAGAPDTNNVDVFIKTKAKFPGWTKADFIDASNLYDLAQLAAESSGDRKLARTLARWQEVFWDIGGRWIADEYERRVGHGKVAGRRY